MVAGCRDRKEVRRKATAMTGIFKKLNFTDQREILVVNPLASFVPQQTTLLHSPQGKKGASTAAEKADHEDT